MAYIPVPKDLNNVKTKFLFNLTKRQLLCFGSGALIGVPLFFVLKNPLGTNVAALIIVFTMLPFFLLAMFERNGQPLEKIVKNMANVLFLRPKQRPYRTKNYYACLIRLEKEVSLENNRKE
ncbi:MAG: PrgI family protein [Candidatus Flemingiibacterium sp.]